MSEESKKIEKEKRDEEALVSDAALELVSGGAIAAKKTPKVTCKSDYCVTDGGGGGDL